ncbi:NAD(P)/FAD-dependent oxidoreductase [Vampirovibrio sp.]|uniref:NAD(P)/FAD-dependent oxidoreductase n=1 Tax=Vampirovibrio sp. TaxID=2717857 RepID=UPI0035931EF1
MPSTPEPPPLTHQKTRIAIIGGGAAGFFAAINTAEKNPRAQITIFEAGHRPLQKVFISGGGRCNLTHRCFDPTRLIEFYPRGQKELRSLFARFQPKDTVSWFERRGLKLKAEADGRMFPVSDNSQDVIDLFRRLAQKHGIEVRTQSRVEAIQQVNGLFEVHNQSAQSQNKMALFDICVITTGYSPTGWKLAAALGHTVIPPTPSLFPFTVKNSLLQDLQGIALTKAGGKMRVSLPDSVQKFEAEGPLLITHTGLSGPMIYRLSAWGASALAGSQYKADLQVDFLPDQTEENLRQTLTQLFTVTESKKKLINLSLAPLPNRLWQALLTESGAPLEEKAESVNKKTINRLVENLKRCPLQISGKSPSKEEFVSCGGVVLKEVDFKTMQSRLVPDLYFGGESLNIDGLTGGFNFQACWSAGWAISESLKSI